MTRNTPKPRTTAFLLAGLVVLIVLTLATPPAAAAGDGSTRARNGSWLDPLHWAVAWITDAVAAWSPAPSALWGQTGHIADPNGTPSSGQTETTGGGEAPPTDAIWGRTGEVADPNGAPSSGQTQATGDGAAPLTSPGEGALLTP